MTANGLLTENFENLVETWTSVNDSNVFALIARGDEFLSQMKGLDMSEKWKSIYHALQDRLIDRRIKELTVKLQNSQASVQELVELRELKGKIHHE